MEQMLKGATAESAINASQVPMNNLTLAELKDGVGAKGPSGIKDARSWMGGVKRYFGGTSDYVAENSAFMGLSQAIISHTNLSADYQGRLMAMLKNGLTAGQIEAAGPEFEAYWRAKEEKKELPALSPEAQQLVSNWQDIAEYTGNVSTEQGVWVKEGSKKRKGKYTLGRDYFIRAIRPDYGRILSKLDSETKMNDSLREIGDILKSEKLIEKVSVDEILKWKNRNSDFTGSRGTVQTQINNFFANLEKARGTKSRLPSAMLDYGVGAVERYIYNWSERMAQIQAYGQALASKDNTDLFDVVENNLNSHNYTKEANYIKKLRRAAYGLDSDDNPFGGSQGEIQRAGVVLNKFATLVMLTGGFNAIRNLTGAGVTTAVFGVTNSISALRNMSLDFEQALENSRSAGILLDNTAMLMSGHDVELEGEGVLDKSDRLLSKGTKEALKWTGFTPAEYFVRIHADNTAVVFATEGIGAIKNRNNSRLENEFKRMAKRLDVDWKKLVEEESNANGDNQTFLNSPEMRKFRRMAVKEVQGGYRFDQLPAFMSTHIGKFIFKFGAYGFQVQRAMVRNVLGEAKAGNVTPLVRMLLTAAGSGEALYELRRLLFGKDRPDASWEEIARSDKKLWLGFKRFLNDLAYTGTLGTVVDITGNVTKFFGGKRFKNPLDPAGLAPVTNTLITFIRDPIIRGSAPNLRDLHDWLKQTIAIYRNLYSVSGQLFPEEFDFAKKAEAEADISFLRNAAGRFHDEAGYEKRYPARDIPVSKYTHLYGRIKDKLLIGDVPAAQKRAIEAANEMPEDVRDSAWKRVSGSIKASQPMRIGVYTSREKQEEFFDWAKKNLDEESVNRIADIQNRYMETAANAGLVSEAPDALKREMKIRMNLKAPKSSRRLRRMPETDYDKRMKEILRR